LLRVHEDHAGTPAAASVAMRGTALVLGALGISVFACSADEPRKEAGRWSCVPLAVAHGETVMCMARSDTPPAPVFQPVADDGPGPVVKSYGVPSASSSSSGGSDGESTPPPTSSSAAPSPPSEYTCSAGGANCPSEGSATYACEEQGSVVDCTQKTLACEEGTMPAATGDRCVPTTPPPSPPPPPSGTPGSYSTVTSNCFEVGLTSETKNADGTTTWTYRVQEHGCQDLSNWVLATGNCPIVSGSNGYQIVSPDPNALLYGVKWEVGGGFSDATFSITTSGGTRGSIKFGAKGPKVAYGLVEGPICK
jgi:hypothetical protein